MSSRLRRGGRTDEVTCSIERTLDIVGDRWSFLILRQVLLYGASKFSDIEKSLGIAPGILTNRLSKLVDAAILEKKVYRENGARERSSYHPTGAGRRLLLVLVAMQQWGDENVALDRGPSLLRRAADDGRPLQLALLDDTGTATPFEQLRFDVGPGFDIPSPVA